VKSRSRSPISGAFGSAPRWGRFPLRVEGRLTAVTDSGYTLAVQSVESVRGATTPWAGEPVTLQRSDVGTVRLRRLDRARTALGAAAAVGAVAAFLLGRSLITGGTDGGRPRLPTDPNPGPST
jgi:hypothetical protein